MSDIIQYDLKYFHENKKISDKEKESEFYIKLKNVLDSLYKIECFNNTNDTNIKLFTASKFYQNSQEKHNKFGSKFVKGNSVLHKSVVKICNLEDAKTDHKHVLSQVNDLLNKISYDNQLRTYNKIHIYTDCTNVELILKKIQHFMLNSTTYNTLYVGLIYYLYENSNANSVKQITLNTLQSMIDSLFQDELFNTRQEGSESYDDFCSRLKDRSMLLSKIKSIILIYQYTEFNESLNKSIDVIIFHIYNCLQQTTLFENKTVESQYLKIKIELLLDCLILFTEKQSIKGLYKKLNLQSNICKDKIIHIREAIEKYSSSDISNAYLKVKFKCLDYIESFDKYFEVE